MRASIWVGLAAMVGGGLFAAYQLIPDEREMAYIHLKDHDFEPARKAYRKLIAEGRSDLSLLVPMVELSMQTGDLVTAARALELMVKEHPRHIEARRTLGRVLRFQHRLDDYVTNLEAICELQPNERDLRDLSHMLDFLRQYDRQIHALKKLADLQPANADYAEELAEVQAARGHLADAAAALMRLNDRNPDAMTEPRMLLLTSLLLDSGRGDDAAALASRWMTRDWNPDTAANLASFFNGRGRLDLAIHLLGPHVDRELATRDRNGAASRPAGTGIPGWILMELAEGARASGDPAFPRKAFALLGWDLVPSPDGARPAQAGNPAGTNGAGRIASSDLPSAEKAGLASLWIQDGDLDNARRLLTDLAEHDDPPEWALADLASVCISLDRTREGLAVFDDLRRRRPTPAAHAGWALLQARAGGERQVMAWLAAQPPGEPAEDVLGQLADLAGDGHLTNLAVAVSARLFKDQPSNAHRIALGRALVDAGRPAEALRELRQARIEGAEAESAWLDTLRAAVRAGLPAKKDIEDFCVPCLARAGLDDAVREDLLDALQAAGSSAAALPALRALAESRGGEWEDAYEEALASSDRRESLRDWLRAKGAREGLPAERRRAVAYDLLDIGDKDGAERIFLALAAHAPSSDPDVEELRYLWGPRPPAPALAWMEARAATAAGSDEQAAWLRMMLDAGAADRVVGRLAREAPGRVFPAVVLGVYLDALAETGEENWLSDLIARTLARQPPADLLLCCARAAWDAGRDGLAAEAYGRLDARASGDPETVRRLAILAFRRGAFADARTYFARSGPSAGDPEADYLLGEIDLRENDPTSAAAHFDRAWQQMSTNAPVSFDERLLLARVMRRTGRTADAAKEYARLASEQPESDTVHSEYEELLQPTAP